MSGANAQAGQGSAAWAEKSLAELTQYIVATHHNFCRAEGARISAAMADALGAPQPGANLARLQRQWTQLQSTLLLHLTKEEQVLFPMIGRLEQAVNAREPIPGFAFGSIAAPIRMMDMEHREVERQFSQIGELTGGFAVPAAAPAAERAIAEALKGYQDDLARHTKLEDEVLFPRAIGLEKDAPRE